VGEPSVPGPVQIPAGWPAWQNQQKYRVPPLQVLVGEPSVPDTVQILRGLKERYASHHGVNIADRALVVAAELADRYITNRFLPGRHDELGGFSKHVEIKPRRPVPGNSEIGGLVHHQPIPAGGWQAGLTGPPST
jgi:hypothetical protein